MARDKRITAKQVKKKLRRIANAKGPEYTYVAPSYEDEYGDTVEAQECYYTDEEGNPSCIIGHLLAEDAPGALRVIHVAEWKGGDLPYEGPACFQVTEFMKNPVYPYNNPIVDLTEIYTEDAIKVMATAQRKQDTGTSWGEVVGIVTDQLHPARVGCSEWVTKGDTWSTWR